MSDLPPDRFFPAAPTLAETCQLVQCAVCKGRLRLARGETFRQKANAKLPEDRRVCGCGRLQITGAPGWQDKEADRRRLGI